MRIERERIVDAPRERVWELVSDPARYPGFFHGITRLDLKGDLERGLGARFSMRMRVGSADVAGLVEVVEFDEPGDVAWTSVTGIDQRGRWRLRETADGRTRVVRAFPTARPAGFCARFPTRSRSRWWRGTSSELCTIWRWRSERTKGHTR